MPPPPEPRLFRAGKDLQTAIKGIAVAAGFYYTIAATAVKLDPNHEPDELIGDQALRPYVLIEWLPSRFEYSGGGAVRVITPVNLYVVSDSDVTDDDDRFKVFTRLCADVEKAIAADPTRGGLVNDTVIRSCEFHTAPDGEQVVALVRAELREHRAYGAA